MEELLKQLHEEVSRDLKGDVFEMRALGTPVNQLRLSLETMLEEIDQNKDYDPFEITNRVLVELNRYHRLKR